MLQVLRWRVRVLKIFTEYFSSTFWVGISVSAIMTTGSEVTFDNSKSLVVCGNKFCSSETTVYDYLLSK